MTDVTDLEQPTTSCVVGIARNGKGYAAIVVADSRVIHISGLDSWPDATEGQVVRATGRLVQEDRMPHASQDANGAWSQGVGGGNFPQGGMAAQWWLDAATWSVTDTKPEPAPWTVRLNDGSGNTTTLSLDADASVAHWRYEPVTPKMSSSGTYSGGEPAQGNLSTGQVDELWRLVHALESTTAAHVTNRAMGTTQVMVDSSTAERSFIVGAGAAVDLEIWLAKLRAVRTLSLGKTERDLRLIP